MVSAFLTLTVTTSCVGLIFQATSIALPKIFAQRLALFETGGAASVGVFVTLVYLVAGAFQVLGGMMADRFPLKWVYLTSYFIQAPVLIVAASLRNWPLVVFACLMVVLQSGAAPAETALFARYSPARWRATALGLKFVIGLGVSAASVPLVALIFETTGGFYWLFVIMGTLAILAATFGLLLPAESGGPPFAAPAVPAAPAAGGD
jgi:MFS family permease